MAGTQLVTVLGFGLAVFMGLLALLMWRKAMNMHALVLEAAQRFEEARRHNGQIEANLAKTTDKLKERREAAAKLEESLSEARAKVAHLTTQLEANTLLREQETERQIRQNAHLNEQVQTLIAQLSEADKARSAAEQRLHGAGKEAQDRARLVEDEAQTKLKDMRARLSEAEKRAAKLQADLETAERRLSEADPEEMKKARRRAAQYARLYTGMRGLRDMAEERNRNWEFALRRFAGWVLEQKAVGFSQTLGNEPSTELGPLVGQALEVIGAQLGEDLPEDSEKPRRANVADKAASAEV